MEGQFDNVKALKIRLANSIATGTGYRIDRIYIEYRGMSGFDDRDPFFRTVALKDGSQKTIANIHGALIHGADCTSGYCSPFLLNMHLNSVDASYELNKMAQAYLYPGETFRIPMNNIKITIDAVQAGSYIDVGMEHP